MCIAVREKETFCKILVIIKLLLYFLKDENKRQYLEIEPIKYLI